MRGQKEEEEEEEEEEAAEDEEKPLPLPHRAPRTAPLHRSVPREYWQAAAGARHASASPPPERCVTSSHKPP